MSHYLKQYLRVIKVVSNCHERPHEILSPVPVGKKLLPQQRHTYTDCTALTHTYAHALTCGLGGVGANLVDDDIARSPLSRSFDPKPSSVSTKVRLKKR